MSGKPRARARPAVSALCTPRRVSAVQPPVAATCTVRMLLDQIMRLTLPYASPLASLQACGARPGRRVCSGNGETGRGEGQGIGYRV